MSSSIGPIITHDSRQ